MNEEKSYIIEIPIDLAGKKATMSYLDLDSNHMINADMMHSFQT
jgi:hypothetical protein